MQTRCSLWLFLGLCLTFAGTAVAEEPEMCVRGRGVPLLSKIPYIGRLFQNAAVVEVDCEKECADGVDLPPALARCRDCRQVGPCVIKFVGADGLERVGIDFDCDVCQGEEACTRECCPAAAAKCETLPPPVAVLPSAEDWLGAMFELRLEMLDTVEEARAELAEREQALIGELLEAKVAAAVAEATLKTHLEAAKQQSRLEKELSEAKADNARLAAKLELAAEKEQLAAELRQAQQELAALKSQTHAAETAQRAQGRARR